MKELINIINLAVNQLDERNGPPDGSREDGSTHRRKRHGLTFNLNNVKITQKSIKYLGIVFDE